MAPSEVEIKIVEKVKFWEEQEKINGILVERLMQLNQELIEVVVENKINKMEIIKIVSRLEEAENDFQSLLNNYTLSIEELEKTQKFIDELNVKFKILQIESYEKSTVQSKRFKATHLTFIFSLIALILSAISIMY